MIICKNCNDENWVCEKHNNKPWDEGGCCGEAGMPCMVCNMPKGNMPPRMLEGFETIISKNGLLN